MHFLLIHDFRIHELVLIVLFLFESVKYPRGSIPILSESKGENILKIKTLKSKFFLKQSLIRSVNFRAVTLTQIQDFFQSAKSQLLKGRNPDRVCEISVTNLINKKICLLKQRKFRKNAGWSDWSISFR